MLTRTISPIELAGLSIQDVFEKLDSRETGLTEEERENRNIRFGKNELPTKSETPIVMVFLKQFTSPFVFLLLGVTVVSLYLREWSDAIVIAIVLLFNAMIGTVQSYRAGKAIKALQSHLVRQTRCSIHGKSVVCKVADLVPGDVVILTAGDRIPADGRWIETNELRVDQASLTGESIANSKTKDQIHIGPNAIAADVRNAGYAGTNVVAGSGKLIISTTGSETEVGHIALSLTEESPEPPLIRRVRTLSHQVLIVVVIAAIILLLASVASGQELISTVVIILALIVAIIPEGLPIVLSIVLARGVQIMSKRNAIVRQLEAVESLGGVDIIFTDKTGTLTENELHFHSASLHGGTHIEITDGEHPSIQSTGSEEDARRFAEILAALADPAAGFETKFTSIDPIDRAFLDLPKQLKIQTPTTFKVRPFNGERRTRAVTTKLSHGDEIAILAGSPEAVFQACELSDEAATEQLHAMTKGGLRVIAVAEAPGGDLEHSDGQWNYLGLVALRDNPRSEAKPAIEWCHAHGIEVVMITGDHPETAFAIAKDLGLATKKSQAMRGEELMRLSDEELKKTLPTLRVVARATPEAKMRLIQLARSEGKIIAMTGDGVNDAPALNAADVGVAMGKIGTDVARESADLILTDDNFATIVAAIQEGRSVVGNVDKVVTYLFATSASELFVIAVAIIAQMPTPLLAAQILWLNLVTDGFQDIALSLEPPHGGNTRPPRGALLSKKAWLRISILGATMGALGFGVYLYALNQDGDMERYAVTLLAMSAMQWWNAWSARSATTSVFQMNPLGNKPLIAATVAVVLLMMTAFYYAPMAELLRVVPLPLETWLWVVPLGAVVVLVDEMWKLANRIRIKEV